MFSPLPALFVNISFQNVARSEEKNNKNCQWLFSWSVLIKFIWYASQSLDMITLFILISVLSSNTLHGTLWNPLSRLSVVRGGEVPRKPLHVWHYNRKSWQLNLMALHKLQWPWHIVQHYLFTGKYWKKCTIKEPCMATLNPTLDMSTTKRFP